MLKTRAAFLLVAAPLAFSAPASADPTVPGCWGFGTYAFCDATVRVETGGSSSQPTPVCAYTCVDVGLPVVELGGETGARVCLDYTAPAGYPGSNCYGYMIDIHYLGEKLNQAFCDRLTKPPSSCDS